MRRFFVGLCVAIVASTAASGAALARKTAGPPRPTNRSLLRLSGLPLRLQSALTRELVQPRHVGASRAHADAVSAATRRFLASHAAARVRNVHFSPLRPHKRREATSAVNDLNWTWYGWVYSGSSHWYWATYWDGPNDGAYDWLYDAYYCTTTCQRGGVYYIYYGAFNVWGGPYYG